MKALLIPMGSAGDVHPFVGLGVALRARGHDVTVLTNPYFESLVRSQDLGFEPLSTTSEFLEAVNNPDLWHPTRALNVVARMASQNGIEPVYRFIERNFTRGSTVVIASCLAIGARIAQDNLGVPLASVHLQPTVFRSVLNPPGMPGIPPAALRARWFARLIYRLVDWKIDHGFAPAINAFRREIGLPPVKKILDYWHSPEIVIGFFPPWFAAPAPDWPPQTRLTGFPLYDASGVEPLPGELEMFLREGPAPVVFTAGSAMSQGRNFFAASVDACARSRRRGILLTRFPDQLPTTLPPAVRHFSYVPFSHVLPRAAAFVHHGGIGTTAQALAAGIPQLVVPMAHDQPDNALRVERLGVGRRLWPKKYTGARATRELDYLTNTPMVRTACAVVAERFKNIHPVEDACGLIEELYVQHQRAAE